MISDIFLPEAKFMCFEGDHALFMQKPVTIFTHILNHIKAEDNREIQCNNNRRLFLSDNSSYSSSSNKSGRVVCVDGESVTVTTTITTTTTAETTNVN